MATIAENLQTIKNSFEAVKQAIIDKEGVIEGDITTWANAITKIPSDESLPTDIASSSEANESNAKIYNYFRQLSVKNNLITSSAACQIIISRDSIKIIDNVECQGNLLEDGSITFKSDLDL